MSLKKKKRANYLTALRRGFWFGINCVVPSFQKVKTLLDVSDHRIDINYDYFLSFSSVLYYDIQSNSSR